MDGECAGSMTCMENFCQDAFGNQFDCCEYAHVCNGGENCCNFELNQYQCRAGDGSCRSDNDCLGTT